MRRPRILVTTSTFPRWPGDTDPPFVYHLCRGLADAFDVHVLAPHHSGCATEETRDGIRIHRYRYAPGALQQLAYDGGLLRRIKQHPLRALLLPGFFLGQWLALLRLQRRYRFRLVHAHWIIPQGIVAALAGRRFLLTSHGGDLFALDGAPLRWLKRLVVSRAEAITVVSAAMVAPCRELGAAPEKIHVQPMGVDPTATFVPPTAPAARSGLLYVGRLVEKKGVTVLLEALSLLRDEGLTLPLTLIGDGPDRRALERQAADSGIAGQVSFLGALRNEDLPAYYQQAAIFVLPSIISADGDQEGLGLVSVEAMACGCAVVASDLPAVRDVVRDRENGLLVAQNSPAALAAALRELADDTALRERLAAAGQASAAHFDWHAVSDHYRRIIAGLLQPGCEPALPSA